MIVLTRPGREVVGHADAIKALKTAAVIKNEPVVLGTGLSTDAFYACGAEWRDGETVASASPLSIREDLNKKVG